MDNLDIRFRKLWRDMDLYGDPAQTQKWLFSKYSTPDRFYHTLEHISNGFDAIDKLTEHHELPPIQRNVVDFAFWFHDCRQTELRSADAACMVLDMGNKSEWCPAVRFLIESTNHKTAPTVYYHKVLLDADLSILGADQETFDKYEANVRKEYAKFSDKQYAAGRLKVLHMFLDRKFIYHTLYGQREWESKARENLFRSVVKLENEVN